MRTTIVLAVVVAVTVAAGSALAASERTGGRVGQATVTARSSRYGKVLFDGRGRVLYLFGRDRGGRSSCSGACAHVWPPFLTKGAPKAAAGVRARLLGTTRRSDGSLQVTYAGHPLYYFKDDVKPGYITCENVSNFGGLWLVVSASGKAVK